MESNNTIPVSVVIPCYNCSKTIKRAIESIVIQKAKPTEIILIDDASKDDTPYVLNKLAQNYNGWIKVYANETNKGAASTRNVGWAYASQNFIAFLDSDDTWHPEKLKIQYEYMQANSQVSLSGHQCVLLTDSNIPPSINTHPHINYISKYSLLFKSPFSTPTVMVKRDIIFRFEEGKRYAEDLLLWQRIVFNGHIINRIESPLAYVHKPLYGVGGLSKQLWKMENGELDNLISLRKDGKINLLIFTIAYLFSLIKFIKRFVVIKIGFKEIKNNYKSI